MRATLAVKRRITWPGGERIGLAARVGVKLFPFKTSTNGSSGSGDCWILLYNYLLFLCVKTAVSVKSVLPNPLFVVQRCVAKEYMSSSASYRYAARMHTLISDVLR